MTVFIGSKAFRNKNGHVKPVYSSNKSADSNERAHTYGDPLFLYAAGEYEERLF